MKCPNCEGDVKVIDTVKNTDTNEIYRKRKCSVCGHVFFSIEFEVEQDERFKQEWLEHYRHKTPRK